MANKPISYKDAGVDIDAGNALIENIKPFTKQTLRPEVIGGLGGFGALFQIPLDKYREPILVSGADGVGTKLKLAMQLNQHDTIGIDLVAMCVNDLIVQGAEPLFFLDYYATSKLQVDTATDVIKGIAEGCKQAGCALIGGETAEMPGLYQAKDYDLAGFCVGIVEKSNLITGSQVKPNDAIIAIASSGVHSNGFSLINKIIEQYGINLNDEFEQSTLGSTLLTPTKIYTQSILTLLEQVNVHAISHITGGGLLENIPRVLPVNCQAQLNAQSWDLPTIFQWIQQHAKIDMQQMYRTFNCGVGMVIIVDHDEAAKTISCLQQLGENAWHIGNIVSAKSTDVRIK